MSSHHDYIIEITAQHDALKPFAPENGQPLRFKIGDAVIYTNEFGAQFRRRVTGFYQPTGLSGLYARGARYLLDSSSPWMPVSESSLRPDDSAGCLRAPCGALRASLASRESPAGYPRRAVLGAPQRPPNRLRRIGQTTAVVVEPVSP